MDQEEGRSRLLSIDESGIQEAPSSSLDAMAGEVASREPDLILVTPGALDLSGDSLVDELNRVGSSYPSYSWTPAPGELPEP
jgi:hypothetical protein